MTRRSAAAAVCSHAVRIRKESIGVLWRITLFAGLSERELRAFTSRSTPVHFDAGSVVVEEGATGLGFFVIESGKAVVSVAGREVRQLGPGDHFGEIALIADTPRTATITAAIDLRGHTITPHGLPRDRRVEPGDRVEAARDPCPRAGRGEATRRLSG